MNHHIFAVRQFKNILRLWSFGEAEPLQRGNVCWMLDVICLLIS